MLSDARFVKVEMKTLIRLATKININVIHTLLLLILDIGVHKALVKTLSSFGFRLFNWRVSLSR